MFSSKFCEISKNMCSTEPAAEHLQKIASAPSSSLSLLLLLISPMFVFRSNSKGFEESKSIISFSLSHFHRFYFLFPCFFCLSQFCSIFFLLLLKKNYCVCVKHKVFCNCLCSSSPSSSRDFASVIQNIGKFGAKNYFTDHRTANTIHIFRDSVSIIKIQGCF